MEDPAPSGAPAGDDEARWAAAQSILDRAPTATAQQRLRRHRLVVWSSVAGVVLVVPAVVMLLVVVLGDGLVGDDDPSSGWAVAGLVVQVVGLLALVASFAIGRRAGLFRGAWSQPTAVLSRAQRRSLLAQVRGHAPVDARRLRLARDLADRLVLQRHQALLLVGLFLQQVGRTMSSPGVVNAVLAGVFLLVLPVSLLVLARDARRADRFLEAHPAEPAPAG